MKWVTPAACAVAILGCAMPRALADTDTRWLVDPNSGCSIFDANARQDDSVSWTGGCDNGLASGKGTAVFSNGGKPFESFTGNFSQGVAQDGPVSVSWGDGWHYDGGEVAGRFSGSGVLVNGAKDRFEGTWLAGKMNGHGLLVRADGERYDGEWKDDLPDGEGTLTRADGTVVKGLFHEGKLQEAVLDQSQVARSDANEPVKDGTGTPKKEAPKKDVPEVRAFEGISGKTLVAVDGSQITLTLIEGGIERQITGIGSRTKKTTFTFLNDRLGTVVEDGGPAAGANVTGFFRLTDTGVEVRYADGRGEMLTATPDGGVRLKLSAVDGDATCHTWYPQGHVFSEADKRLAVAEYASRLGLGPPPKESCEEAAPAASAMAPPSALHPADAKPREKALKAKPTSFISPNPIAPRAAPTREAPARLASLTPVKVKDSVVHTIDAMDATPPVVITALPSAASPLPSGEHDASSCLKVESDGNHWAFRNSCGYSVQFAYCMWHGSEKLAACDGGHSISGSVAANSLATLTSDTRFGGKDDGHDFRWVACDGGAGEVVAHLDRADPPSGRCERAGLATSH